MRWPLWMVLVAAVLWASGVRVVNAGLDVWTSIGPDGGSVSALAVDPTHPTTVYAGTFGGVFKSTDGGGSWRAANTGLTDFRVSALVIDPATPATLYAGTTFGGGVFKSTDGGGSWSPANIGLPNGVVQALAIDPTTPTTLYAGTAGGLYKSRNGGRFWRATGLTDDVSALAIDPATPTTLYAGTRQSGVFKSTDGGASWSAASTELVISYLGLYVYALAIDPQTPSTLYAGSGPEPGTGKGVFKSTDGGASWSALSRPRQGGVFTLAIDPATPSTLYAATEFGGVLKSTDGGASWSAAKSGLGDVSISALAIDPATPTTVLAGTSGDGLFKSTDGGASWSPANTGLTNPFIETLAMNPTTLYAGTYGSVFAMSRIESCRAAGSSLLWGRITHAGGLQGVPDVTVTLEGPNGCKNLVTTDAPGVFGFSTLGDGPYTLTPSQAGCTSSPPSEDVTIAGNSPQVSFLTTCP